MLAAWEQDEHQNLRPEAGEEVLKGNNWLATLHWPNRLQFMGFKISTYQTHDQAAHPEGTTAAATTTIPAPVNMMHPGGVETARYVDGGGSRDDVAWSRLATHKRV